MSRPASAFAFTGDERPRQAKLHDHSPEAVLELEVSIHEQVATALYGLTVTETRADEVLGGLLDRITAGTAPPTWSALREGAAAGCPGVAGGAGRPAHVRAAVRGRVVETGTN